MKLEKSNEVTEQELKKERRTFLKKAVYKAPALIVMGSLVKPVVANASCTDPGPLGCPEDPPQPQ